MGHVTVTINGRAYKVGCGDGEESRLRQLADSLCIRVERLAQDFGQHGNERLLLMAALLATDELLEAKSRLADLGDDAASYADDIDGPSANSEDPQSPPLPSQRGDPINLTPPEPARSTATATTTPNDIDAEPPSNKAPAQASTKPALQPAEPAHPRGSLEARLAMARSGKSTSPPRTGS